MGKAQKQANNALTIRRKAFFEKMDEYDKLTLDELKELFNHPDKKKRPGGIYRQALIEVVRRKQLALANQAVAEGTAAVLEQPVVEEIPQAENPESNT